MMRFGMGNEAIQMAVKDGDYNAFVTAWNADTNKPSDATVPTQEQFNTMVAMEQKRVAVETAIANNDYDAFVKATTPTREEFDAIVSHQKSRAVTEAAIKANDYAAFQTAVKGTPMEDLTEEEFAKLTKRAEMKEQNK